MINKSIETKIDGFHFRSRLEARWYVFFKKCHIHVDYEPEGFSLPSGWYLPDFFIPTQEYFPKALWVEVKGIVSELDWSLLQELVQHSGVRGTMLFGLPNPALGELTDPTLGYEILFPQQSSKDLVPHDGDTNYQFCQCPMCKKFGFEFNGRSARIGCRCDHSKIANGDKTYSADAPVLIQAYRNALGYRFA